MFPSSKMEDRMAGAAQAKPADDRDDGMERRPAARADLTFDPLAPETVRNRKAWP